MQNLIQQSIEIIGSQSALARACDVSQVAVHKWMLGGGVSPSSALAIERATDGKITAAQLLPNIFGNQ